MNYDQLVRKLASVDVHDDKFCSQIDHINRQIEGLLKLRENLCIGFIKELEQEIDDSEMSLEYKENEKKKIAWVICQIQSNHHGELTNPYL